MLSIINISAYRFVHLSNNFVLTLRNILEQEALRLSIRGTILLSTEGINLFLAGQKEAVNKFQALLHRFYYFKNLPFKESVSNTVPFKKMLVKIKNEIISFGMTAVQDSSPAAPYIPPATLKEWLADRPDLVLLDTRNAFEVGMGSFENAIHLNLRHFKDFPKAVSRLQEKIRTLPIVTFCTGGIRCEKASAFLIQAGFREVYQLEGGILNYFEQCGGHRYKGLCFVFDARKALTPALEVAPGI